MPQPFDPTRGLLLRQVENSLARWRALPRRPPASGWIRVIRQALGMSAAQLAHRLDISRQSLAALERREQNGTVTLAALSRAAEALGCDLVYALVPRSELKTMIETQAKLRAEEEILSTAHSMRLEAQGVSPKETQRLIHERAMQLISSRSGKLWSGPTPETPVSGMTRRNRSRGSITR